MVTVQDDGVLKCGYTPSQCQRSPTWPSAVSCTQLYSYWGNSLHSNLTAQQAQTPLRPFKSQISLRHNSKSAQACLAWQQQARQPILSIRNAAKSSAMVLDQVSHSCWLLNQTCKQLHSAAEQRLTWLMTAHTPDVVSYIACASWYFVAKASGWTTWPI